MMDRSRPSDTLSYLDASPRTSPLANRSAKRRHATEQPELESPSKRLRSNAPEPTSSAVYNRHDRPSQSPHGVPSQNEADDDGEPASDEEDNDEVDDYVPPAQPQWSEESTPSPSVDSEHSDLVSPDAPLPRGWPDNMSPRWNWLKNMTCYDLYKNPISPPGGKKKASCAHGSDRGGPAEEHEDELYQGRPGAGASGEQSEERDEPKDPEFGADEDAPEEAEEQAEDSGVDVSGEQGADEEREDAADDEVEEDHLQDEEEVDELQDDEDEAGPSQPVPAPSTPPRMTRRSHRQYEMSSPKNTRDPFHPTPRSRDFNGREINHNKFREDTGHYDSPCIT